MVPDRSVPSQKPDNLCRIFDSAWSKEMTLGNSAINVFASAVDFEVSSKEFSGGIQMLFLQACKQGCHSTEIVHSDRSAPLLAFCELPVQCLQYVPVPKQYDRFYRVMTMLLLVR
jgi:hypothetical protein